MGICRGVRTKARRMRRAGLPRRQTLDLPALQDYSAHCASPLRGRPQGPFTPLHGVVQKRQQGSTARPLDRCRQALRAQPPVGTLRLHHQHLLRTAARRISISSDPLLMIGAFITDYFVVFNTIIV